MELVVQLGIMVLFGGICASIASSRGRNAVGWFFVGFVAPCIGLILVLVLPDLNAENERRRRMSKENRRLKEELRLNRTVSDRRHTDTQRRLRVHDRALGVDSSGTRGKMLPTSAGAAPAPPPLPAPARATGPVRWFYEVNGERSGPIGRDEIQRLWFTGEIRPETLVWRAGMAEWQEAGVTKDLLDAVDG